MEAAEKPGLMKSAIEEFDHTPDVGMMLAPEVFFSNFECLSFLGPKRDG